MKDEHNSFHYGSDRSFIEVYEETLAVKAGWDAYNEEKRITVATCPRAGEFRYEKLYEKFLFARYPNLHKSWFAYDCTKNATNLMKRHQVWSPLKTLCREEGGLPQLDTAERNGGHVAF